MSAGLLDLEQQLSGHGVGSSVHTLLAGFVQLGSPWQSVLFLEFVGGKGAKWHEGSRSDMSFIDVASIHQLDLTLMERGVFGIGGWLKLACMTARFWDSIPVKLVSRKRDDARKPREAIARRISKELRILWSVP